MSSSFEKCLRRGEYRVPTLPTVCLDDDELAAAAVAERMTRGATTERKVVNSVRPSSPIPLNRSLSINGSSFSSAAP